LRRFWRSRPEPKEKGHIAVAKIYISEFRDDDNKCASFIYSDAHSVEEFSLF
jgi:hypothetical protein